MKLSFFIGEYEIPIEPKKSKNNSSEYYAWCLQLAINKLTKAKTIKMKQQTLINFKNDMNGSKATQAMFKDIASVFDSILYDHSKMDTNYLIGFISGILDFNNGYMDVRVLQ